MRTRIIVATGRSSGTRRVQATLTQLSLDTGPLESLFIRAPDKYSAGTNMVLEDLRSDGVRYSNPSTALNALLSWRTPAPFVTGSDKP